MKTVPVGIVGVAAAAGLLFSLTALQAQEEDEPQPIVSRASAATIDYGNDAIFQPAKHNTDFDRLGLLPQQLLPSRCSFQPSWQVRS